MPTAITRWAAEEAYSSLEFVTWPDHLSLHKKRKLPQLVAPLCKDKVEIQTGWDVVLILLPLLWSQYHAVL